MLLISFYGASITLMSKLESLQRNYNENYKFYILHEYKHKILHKVSAIKSSNMYKKIIVFKWSLSQEGEVGLIFSNQSM